MSTRQINELTAIRGIAALSIVVHHFYASFNQTAYGLLSQQTQYVAQSYLWVDMFFMLSGYVLAHRYTDLKFRKNEISQFLIARLARIYPLHFVVLLLFLFIEIVQTLNHVSSFESPNSVLNFFRNLFLLQGIQLSHIDTSWNHPAWSISIEWSAYLIFPVMIVLLRHAPAWVVATGAVFGILVLTFLANLTASNLDVTGILGLIRCIIEMYFGAVLFLFRQKPGAIVGALPRWFSPTLIFITLVATLHFGITDALVVAIMGLFMFSIGMRSAAYPNDPILRLLNTKIMIYLGTVSYSIYLCHLLILMGTTVIAKSLDLSTPLALVFAIIATLLISPLGYHFIEKPGQNFVKKAFRQKVTT